MWIEKTKSGSLRAVERYLIDGKYKRVSVPISRDTAQARRAAQEELSKRMRASVCPTADKSLYEAIRDYLTTKECRESTRKYLEAEFRSIKDIMEDMPMSSLTPGFIKRAFTLWNKSPNVVNRAIIAFRTFSKWCYELEYTETDLGARLSLIKTMEKEKDPEELYLEADQLRSILDNLSGMPYYFTQFLALTGCRIGEACALTLEDVDEKYIHISKSFSDHTGEVTLPKNKSSIRDIYIQPELADLLHEYRQWRALNIMALGILPKTLFYSRTGTIYQERYYRNVLYKLGTHPHALRHTHVALLAEQGIPLDVIARRLGHSGTATTRKVYYHVTQKQKEKDEAAIAKVHIL